MDSNLVNIVTGWFEGQTKSFRIWFLRSYMETMELSEIRQIKNIARKAKKTAAVSVPVSLECVSVPAGEFGLLWSEEDMVNFIDALLMEVTFRDRDTRVTTLKVRFLAEDELKNLHNMVNAYKRIVRRKENTIE